MTNKETAFAINHAVQSLDIEKAAALVSENYILHNPITTTEFKDYISYLEKIKTNDIPVPKLTTLRVIEDGNFVALHQEAQWPNRKAMFEIFRFNNGLATEHWSAFMDHPEFTINGNSMFDGSIEIKNPEETEANKEKAKALMEKVFLKRDFDRSSLEEFFDSEVIQHHPYIDNSIDGFLKWFSKCKQVGLTLQIHQIHQIVGQGNFVLVFSEGSFEKDEKKPTSFFDLFRFENGKILEHWGLFQEIPEKIKQNSSLFNLSLYKRVGSYDGIAAFIDHAFPQVASHPELQQFFLGHSMSTKMRQRQLIIDSLSSTLQGPTVYLGKPLKEIHKGLNITLAQWETFMKVISRSMDEMGIKGNTKKDFYDHFESFRSLTVESELDNK